MTTDRFVELTKEEPIAPYARKQFSVLTINGGSSSIRFALYEEGEPLRPTLQWESGSGRSERHKSQLSLPGEDRTGQSPH